MNKNVMLSWLILVALIATSAFAPVTAASLSTSTSSSAELQRGVLADSDDSDDQEDPDNPPTPEPPLDSAPETPLIPTQSKPTILDQSNWSPPQPLQPIIAYTFPSGTSNWTIPVRAAAFVEITPDPSETFTPVGMVEIGDNPETETESQIYVVSIDLNSRETRVKGQLIPVSLADIDISSDISSFAAISSVAVEDSAEDSADVIFLRIPQRLNPDRINSPYEEFQGLPSPPDNMATISADGVCFVVKVSNGTGSSGDGDSDDDADDGTNNDDSTDGGPIYNSYCSKPSGLDGSDDPLSPLSVMDNFPSQYAELQSSISDVAVGVDLENRIQMDEIISTRESILGIQDCASALTEEACGSDIIAAPVTEWYFEHQYSRAFGGDGENNGEDDDREHQDDESGLNSSPFLFGSLSVMKSLIQPITPAQIAAAAVKILKPIETPDTIIQPGDYVMHLWFNSNGVFYAATLTGVTTDSTVVTNQQIPAIPALFIDRRSEGPRQPSAQITGLKLNWRGRSVCALWENC